jgi:excisionase family DNA binding protein
MLSVPSSILTFATNQLRKLSEPSFRPSTMTLKETTHSIAAAAKILGIGRDLCKRAVEKGQIPSLKIGERDRISDAAVRRILREAGGDEPAASPVATRDAAA